MEKFKSPKGDIRFTKEIKHIKIKSKDNESFHYSKSPNVGKNHSYKEIISIKNNKNTTRNDVLNPLNKKENIKEKDKKVITQVKPRVDKTIKEKKLSNIPNKGKGRSLEKAPIENIHRNKNNNILDLNKKKKLVIDIGKKSPKNNNSVGKNKNNNDNIKNKNNKINGGTNEDMKKKILIRNNKNNKNENIKNINNNKNIKNEDINKNKNNKSEDINIDNFKNININEETGKKNNYINYNIINNNINSSAKINSEEDNIPFKKYNSVCVSINNNYNYNVSLTKPSQSENYDNFINTGFLKTNIDNNNNKNINKDKEKEANWKEKINKINKQKNDIKYLDIKKKLNNTDSNFWKSRNELNIRKDEDLKMINKTDINNNINLNVKQKMKKVNSSIIPGKNNKIEKVENENANEDKSNKPKKKTGILGFLRTFKDMINLRKKSDKNNNDHSNNSANITKNDIKEKLNKADSNNSDNNKNLESNTINETKVEIDNNQNNIYEKRKINMNVNKNNEKLNDNYYSDSAYDSCPVPNNNKNANLYDSPNINKNKNKLSINLNNPQILSYSHKNILKNNNSYNNDIHFKQKVESSSGLMMNKKNQNQPYNNNKTEETPNSNSLFNFFGILNNKIYKKSNNNNIMTKNKTTPLNEITSNSAYVKKTKRIMFSPKPFDKNENNNENKNNMDNYNNINNEKEERRLSFNKPLYNFNNNNYSINFNNANIGEETIIKPLNKRKFPENYGKEKYNSENLNENLNINAEKKIQEIKINIGNKKDNMHYNNTMNFDGRGHINNLNNQYMNNNNNKQLYNTVEDFLPSPKPKTEIESCIINFNKNKQMKIYENNLYNKTNTPMNHYINNDNIINNVNRIPLIDNYNSNSYSNIRDINTINNINNNKNIYSKPNNKNYIFNQNDNNNLRREKNISSDLNIDMFNNNINTQKPIKKKIFVNKNEPILKVNRLVDSEEFDNDINSVNSDSSSNTSKEFNRTQLLPSSNIYTKPFKTYIINNNKNNSAKNSFENIFKKDDKSDNSKYNTDFIVENNDRDLNITNSTMFKSHNHNNNIKMIYYNKNNNLNHTDIDIYQDNNNNNISNLGQIIYSKKPNSSKHNRVLAINDITPLPSNDYNLTDDIKINNYKPIIRPKVIQKNMTFIQKLYNYSLKYPKNVEKNHYFSIEHYKIYKLPLKKLCLQTKNYYKIMQPPIVKNNYISKKRISNKEGIKMPKSQKCYFIKKNMIINILDNLNYNYKRVISKEIENQFNDDVMLYKLSNDFTEVETTKLEENKLSDINTDYKEETQINLEKELENKIEITELENKNNQNININDEIEINSNKKYSTPTQNSKNSKENEENQIESPRFASKSENKLSKLGKNKIISIEIQLNNKDKSNNTNNIDINRNLCTSYNNMPLNKNEGLYIKKKPNANLNNSSNKNINNNNKIIYYKTENDKSKTYVKPHKVSNDEVNITKFILDDSNIYQNNYKNKSNKIICIDIDLSKEQKKLQEQREAKEIKTYKRPTFTPFLNPTKNLRNKIDTIAIDYKQNNNINNLNNNINNNNLNNITNDDNLDCDKIKQEMIQEIIFKLEIISENNLLLIVEQFVDLLTKKVILDSINNNLNYNKIRLAFMDILSNEYIFSEIIINKAISEINKIKIYSNLCYELCVRLTNEINGRENNTEEDLKTLLAEGCKLKFEEIIMDNTYNYNDNKLLGIILFICDLINFRIISIDIGYFCFEKLCNKYNEVLYENGNIYKYYYLDIIIELLKKFGKIIYYEKKMKYLERIDNYVDTELNSIINNNVDLPEMLRNKIINLIKTKRSQWKY